MYIEFFDSDKIDKFPKNLKLPNVTQNETQKWKMINWILIDHRNRIHNNPPET